MNELTVQQLQAIFLQIVKDMDYQAGLQINTIAVIDAAPDLRGESFGMDYQHYLDGTFWSRSWVNQGADPNDIKGEFPVLFVEQRSATGLVPDLKEIQYPVDLLLVDKLECPDCPPGDRRTGETTKRNVLTMLRSFLAELYTYQLWTVDRSGDVTQEWISEGRRQVYEADITIDLLELLDDLVTVLETETVQFSEWGNFPDLRGWFITLDFIFCEDLSTSFNYQNTVVPELATTQCDSC